MEQMSRLHGTACYRQCGFNAKKLSRLEACEDWNGGTQASSQNSQGINDGEVNEAGINTAAPNRCAVLCG